MAANFNVEISPSNLTVSPTGTVSFNYNFEWQDVGNSGLVATFGVTALPSGVTAVCSPSTVSFGGNAYGTANGTVTLSAAVDAPPTNGPVNFNFSVTVPGLPIPSLTPNLTVKQGFYTARGSVTYFAYYLANCIDPASPNELATAPVRDPLWMLGRQWQLREFQGDDAGSAIQVRYLAQQSNIDRYFGGSGIASAFNGTSAALETTVESEPVNLSLRGAMQFGLRFEAMLRDAQTSLGLDGPGLAALLSSFRSAFPITPLTAQALFDVHAAAISKLAAGSVTNGWALYQLASANPASPLIPAGAGTVVTGFVTWAQSIYAKPGTDPAWNAERMTYHFGSAATAGAAAIKMISPDFPGGKLDWYDFDAAQSPNPSPLGRQPIGGVQLSSAPSNSGSSSGTTVPAGTASVPPPPIVIAGTSLPHHVRFAGMPEPRYWNCEDGKLNLAAIQPNMTDVATLAVLEFAFVYSNDWFVLTIPTPIGTVTQVAGIIVTDTFGIRTLITATGGTTTGVGGNVAWDMFTMSGAAAQTDSVLLAPTLADVQDGAPIEEAWFARDDMAAMAWAEEHTLQGPLDSGIDVYEDVLRRAPPAAPVQTQSTTAQIAYVLGTGVPQNWIPMVPVPNDSLFRLRRGAMAPLDPKTNTPNPIYPRGVILRQDQLQSGQPPILLVRDSAIPPTGVQVTRYFRRARWIDGSTACWIARKVTAGKGQASSGLAFDVLQPVTPQNKS
jgi:hypothetical protein